jgi:hypothetical protein
MLRIVLVFHVEHLLAGEVPERRLDGFTTIASLHAEKVALLTTFVSIARLCVHYLADCQ